MRSEVESVKIIHCIRTVDIEADLEDLVKFNENADLLMQLASAHMDQTSPAFGESSVDTHLPTTPLDDISSLVEHLNSAVSNLDVSARTVYWHSEWIRVERTLS
ncbi:hypothetical protein LZ30DRAFT_827196 [Colletotrichum cereale]|nr:hypothetical protein LZ30DRAFT_827196 [Colletotrichum cereale]